MISVGENQLLDAVRELTRRLNDAAAENARLSIENRLLLDAMRELAAIGADLAQMGAEHGCHDHRGD